MWLEDHNLTSAATHVALLWAGKACKNKNKNVDDDDDDDDDNNNNNNNNTTNPAADPSQPAVYKQVLQQ